MEVSADISEEVSEHAQWNEWAESVSVHVRARRHVSVTWVCSGSGLHPHVTICPDWLTA